MVGVFAATRSGPESATALNPAPPAAPSAGDVAVDAAGPAAEEPAAPPGDVEIAPPPEQFDEPATTAPPPQALASRRFANVVPSGGTWAVMIGVNDYPGTRHDLRSAVADAQDVSEALGRMGVPADHRLMVTDRQATASTIKVAAEWLTAHAGPDAVAVFFYAGHVRKIDGDTEAILAADGKLVSDVDLGAALRPLKAKRAWIGIAACYAGGFTEVMAPGRILTAAAPANKLAYENTRFGRSYMVQYMIREAMIDNRAPGSVQQAFEYARASIARDYPGREPVQFDSAGGPLSLRPLSAGAPPPAQHAPGPAPAPAPAEQQSSTPPPSQPPKDCKGVPIGIKCR